MPRQFKFLLFILLTMGVTQAGAISPGEPTGRVILTIDGAISVTNGDSILRLDAAMFTAIGESTLTTTTTWTEGVQEFRGVLGRDLMQAIGASGSVLQAVAINDYKIEIPVSDFDKWDVLFATSMNGKRLSRRDKGPIWVIYPKSAGGDVNAYTDSKSIWQLIKLTVE